MELNMRSLIGGALAMWSLGGHAASAQSSHVTVMYQPPAALLLHEPVVVGFRVNNNLPEAVSFNLGWNRTSAFALSIKHPDGTIVQAPAPKADGPGWRGEVTVEEGASYSQQLLLNQWSSFEQVGPYQVEIRMAASIVTSRGTIVRRATTDHIQLQISGRNEGALDQLCRRLADTAWSSPNAGEGYEAALRLSYVNDPVGVRYMRYVLAATDRVDPVLFDGLRRINSAEARAVLAEAAQTGTGERARTASNILRLLQMGDAQRK
jgi:hypothetical protein